MFVHVIWLAPIHLGVVTYLVYLELGWISLLIVAFVFLNIPLQLCLGMVYIRSR